MRRNAALFTMLAVEAGVAILALFFQVRSRVAILAAFRDFGTELPASARVALAPWFLPAALGVAALASLLGIVAPVRPRRRALLVGVGLLVSSVALVFAIAAGFGAIFGAS